MLNFWDNHTFWFVISMFFFPRITMLFFTTFGGGFLYWLGWFFAPRLTVAIIATILYNENNVVLLIFTWMWALCGDVSEKAVVAKGSQRAKEKINI